MTDVHNPKTRSFNMSRIKGKNTKPEMLVRRILHSKGFRYRLHNSQLPGKPDLVFKSRKTVVFVHGCFWHAHERCEKFVLPKTRTKWWKAKLFSNRERDKLNESKLREAGWCVITVFECELKPSDLPKTIENLVRRLLERSITADVGIRN